MSRLEQSSDNPCATTGTPTSKTADKSASPELPTELGRYAIVREIGRGGMGTVYEVRDEDRARTLALKTLRVPDPGAVADLKREFRIVAELTHRNLVTRHELAADQGTWFFTMEYIDGCNVVEHVRQDGGPNYTRVRDTLRQLASGLNALHRVGLLHQDIKPPNALVSHSGRLVLLDFGLASTAGAEHDEWGRSVAGWGTAGYLAPERAIGGAVTAASDWFSVGVVLYEMLNGRLPPRKSTGRLKLLAAEVDDAKLAFPDDCPIELRDLCSHLLRSRRSARAGAAEVDQVLGQTNSDRDCGPFSGLRDMSQQHFVGRRAQLATLTNAHEIALDGRLAIAHVRGNSGMGKTALVDRFLMTCASGSEVAVVLRGRCFERESVPFKAFDQFADSLTQLLMTLSRAELAEVIPEDIHLLLRMFPVLRRVHELDKIRAPSDDAGDVHQQRRRAFRALKTLLSRLTDSHQVIMVIDDIHWGDRDSAHLLMELVSSPKPPALLLVLSYRADDIQDSPCLREFLKHHDASATRTFKVDLGALTANDASTLALKLGVQAGDTTADAQAIALEAAGSPFLVKVLARYASLAGGSLTGVSLHDVLAEELERLTPGAKRLLMIVAVRGSPLAFNTAMSAADPADDPRATLNEACDRRLLRATGGAQPHSIEVYHDAIRTTVIALLSPRQIEDVHRVLADAFEQAEHVDHEALARHHHGAGNLPAAARHAAVAGDRATEIFAFGRAADLYGLARDCTPTENVALTLKQATALEKAGHCHDAADLFLLCADRTHDAEAWDHSRRAAEQYLLSGRVEQGIATLRPVLKHQRLPFPRAPWTAMAAIVIDLAVLSLRKRAFVVRRSSEITEDQVAQLQTCFAAGRGLAPYDPLRAAYFVVRGTLLALRAGDAAHVARGLSFIGMMYVSDGGSRSVTKGLALIDEGERLAARHGMTAVLGWVSAVRGIAITSNGDWRASIDELDEGVALMRSQTIGTQWEQSNCVATSLLSLAALGELEEMRLRAQRLRREAAEVGDVIMTVEGSLYLSLAELANDEPAVARRRLRDTMARWTREGYYYQHWTALRYRIYCDLYNGTAADAVAPLEDGCRKAKSARLFDNQIVRGEAPLLRAYTALACIDADPKTAPEHTRTIEKAVTHLERMRRPWTEAAAFGLRAGLAHVRGHTDGTVAWLRRARATFHLANMALHASSMKWRLGEVLGGAHGAALIEASGAEMRKSGVTHPQRWVRVYAPGFASEPR